MNGSDDRDVADGLLLTQMLLVHEKRLRQIDEELRSIREELTNMKSIREELSYWIRLSKKLRHTDRWIGKDPQENL